MIAAHLETGDEVMLLDANATELSRAPDGLAVAYNSADGHFSMNRWQLMLELLAADRETDLHTAIGKPERLTHCRGIWHVHGGAWMSDRQSLMLSSSCGSSPHCPFVLTA